MKLGRPKIVKEKKKSELVGIRLNEKDRAYAEKAANRSGKKLSAWIRDVINAASSRHAKP
jgi:predicted HicB family RNase H-like nuclease